MAKTDYQSVHEYIASQPKDVQRVLRRVRAAVRRGTPGATEVISYQIPAYKLDGRAVIYFAGWKEHYSLYPATPGVLQQFASELTGHLVSKGTIRFPLAQPVPDKLIERIAKLRTEETAAITAAKRSARRPGAASAGTRKPRARARGPAKDAARKPNAPKPAVRTPREGKPAVRTPSAGKPAGRTPRAGKPAGRTPRAGKPAGRTPRAGKPAGRTPARRR